MYLVDKLSEEAKQDVMSLYYSFHMGIVDGRAEHVFISKEYASDPMPKLTSNNANKYPTVSIIDYLGKKNWPSIYNTRKMSEYILQSRYDVMIGNAAHEFIYVSSRTRHVEKVLGSRVLTMLEVCRHSDWWYKLSESTITEISNLIDDVVKIIDKTRAKVKSGKNGTAAYTPSKTMDLVIIGHNVRHIYAAITVEMAYDGVLDEAIIDTLVAGVMSNERPLANNPQAWVGYVCSNIVGCKLFKDRIDAAISKYTWSKLHPFDVLMNMGNVNPQPLPIIVEVVKEAMDKKLMEYLRNRLKPYFNIKKTHT